MGSLRTVKRRLQRKAAKARPRPGVYLIPTAAERAAYQEAIALAYDHYHGRPGYENLKRPPGIRPYRG